MDSDFNKLIYLRSDDFKMNGNLIDDYFKNKFVVVFVHADFCRYCIDAKPEFIKALTKNKNNNVLFFGIKLDGDVKGESECEIILHRILKNYEGFPDYAFFYDKKPILNVDSVVERDCDSILKNIDKIIKNKKLTFT